MSPNKAELRLQAKARRANRGQLEVSSDLIVWINRTISKGATIACYISREDELNTAELIELLKFEYQVVSPVTTSHGLIFKEHGTALQCALPRQSRLSKPLTAGNFQDFGVN